MTRAARAAVLAFALAGCVDGSPAVVSDAAVAPGGAAVDSPDAAYLFIAFASTFRSFRGWEAFHEPGPPDDATYSPDVLGPRTQYLNRHPPHGAATVPVGTIIVEARESGEKKIFAAVKRGAGFNATGTRDWEWFELAEAPDRVLVVWRGFGPPTNDSYGGDPEGGCNACHLACGAGNDAICSPSLQLAKF